MDRTLSFLEARAMRDELEGALLERIEQMLDALDAHAGEVLPQPTDTGYLAERDRIDLFFAADRLKYQDQTVAARFGLAPSPTVWATSTCQPFPGRNRFVKSLGGGLELWFRVECAFRAFAGFTVYDAENHGLIVFDDVPSDIANDLLSTLGVDRESVAGNCWWALTKYLPAGEEASSPNFRLMDDLSLELLDGAAFDRFIGESEKLVDDLLQAVL